MAATIAHPGCRPCPRRFTTHALPGPRLRHSPGGFTILESMIGVLILTATIGGLAILATRQWSSSNDVDILERVEATVARDLGWLKTYAKYWRMTRGPYNLTCTQAGFSSGCNPFIVSAGTSEYNPDPSGNTCPNPTGTPVVADTALASAFVQAAESARSTLTPAGPFPIAIGNTTLISGGSSDTGQPRLAAGTTLVRSISLGRTLITISYSFSGSDATPYGFRREVALYPEAAAWCP